MNAIEKNWDSSQKRPFELDLSQEVCDRATRVARTLFGVVDAQVILVKDGKAWRSREPARDHPIGPGLGLVLETGKPFWLEDALTDERFASLDEVVGPPHLRFYAAAPIAISDGTTPGALVVTGLQSRPFNAGLAARLNDLATFIADAWIQAQATRAKEQARRDREAVAATFAAVVQAMPVALVITDRDYRVLGCSPRWAAEAGLTDKEAIGRSVAELRPNHFTRWRPFFDRVMAGETIEDDRVRYPRDDGSVGWLAAEMTPWRDLDGEVGGVIVSSHDVTGMVESLEEAARSEERLTLAMEIADIHVWEMDYVRRDLVKAGSEDTFFTEPKTYEELASDIFATIDPRDRPAVEEAWRRHVEEGMPYRPEYRLVRSDGLEVWTAGSSRLINDSRGRPTRLIGAMQNITERKAGEAALVSAKEAAEMANRAKSSFLATISHEIRTPLNGVLGMAQAMAAGSLTPEQRDRLNIIRDSGETLLGILNDVLDLSKIEAGKMVVEESEFDLARLIIDAHASFSATATNKGVTFEYHVDQPARGIYLGDATRVRQILHNLISNALKFTVQGKVAFTVVHQAGGLEFRVSDTGIGIPAARLPELFQKFEQVDASTSRRYGGTGLGLAICRELSERMGGSIRAESEEGIGTTFIVRIPLMRLREATEGVAKENDAGTEVEDFGDLRVLAAEDNTVNQLVLKALLTVAGVDPFVVSDGAEAIAAWKDREWDVILMDVQMPGVDGPTASRTIRALERETGRQRTPIIALTANAMAHQVAEYREAGMDGFVAKPIQVDRLFAELERTLADSAENAAQIDSAAVAEC